MKRLINRLVNRPGLVAEARAHDLENINQEQVDQERVAQGQAEKARADQEREGSCEWIAIPYLHFLRRTYKHAHGNY